MQLDSLISSIKEDTILIFNLDGVLTKESIDSVLSKNLEIQKILLELDWEYNQGKKPFLQNFMKKIYNLYHEKQENIENNLKNIKLNKSIVSLVQSMPNALVISEYPNLWLSPLMKDLKLEHKLISSVFDIKLSDQEYALRKFTYILNKKDVVNALKKTKKVVYIGSSYEDFEAMAGLEYGIYYGDFNKVSETLFQKATHYIYKEEILCQFIKQFQ